MRVGPVLSPGSFQGKVGSGGSESETEAGVRRGDDKALPGALKTTDAATSQGHLEPQELEEAGRILPEALQRDCDHAHTLTSDFWPPGL